MLKTGLHRSTLAWALFLLVALGGCGSDPGSDDDPVGLSPAPVPQWGDYEPAWSPDGSEIAVSSTRWDPDFAPSLRLAGTLFDIYVIDLTGNTTQLLFDSHARAPSWSPDGLQVASVTAQVFVPFGTTAQDTPRNQILLRSRDFGGLIRIGVDFRVGHLAWSPDGTTIAFSTSESGQESHLYLLDLAAAAELRATDPTNYKAVATRLTQPGSSSSGFSWSPDSSQGVFSATYNSNITLLVDHQIYRMQADGSDIVKLTDLPAGAMDPAWSPCGTEVAFLSAPNGVDLLVHVMDADGSNIRVLTDDAGSAGRPSWSPDCTQLAFASNRETIARETPDIWIVNVDGSGLRRLTLR